MHVSNSCTYAFRLDPGADLRAELIARTQAFTAAALVTCVGSLTTACLRLADESLPPPFEGPFEIVAVSGTLGSGRCHLHLAVADAAGRMLGGHMLEGCRVHTTAEVVLTVLDDLVFRRTFDARTGFDELSIHGRET